MNYIFKGNLCGLLCSECSESLQGVKVRLYYTAKDQNVTLLAAADARETFHQINESEQKSRSNLLLAETVTDEKGNFTFDLDEKNKYKGEAFDIDFVCGTGYGKPHPPKKESEFQFHITTVQPQWREKANYYFFGWEYCISAKWWCRILQLLDIWVICGRVLNNNNNIPISGVRVEAFDVDLIQDDPIGSGITNMSGYFRIYYTSADFSKTIFSWLNVEWPAGPDIYFKLYDIATNTLVYAEDRSVGHRADRENRGNCFCVTLLIDVSVPVTPPTAIPAFLNIGGIDYETQMHSHVNENGLTNANYAFYSTLRLNGILAQTLSGVPMEYCFEYTKDFNGAGLPINWQRVLSPQIATTNIGYVQKATLVNFPFPHYVYNNKNCYVSNVAIAGAITTPVAADGWILVPQQNDNPLDPLGQGLFVSNGNQIALDSTKLAAFPPINLPALVAGNSAGPTLASDQVFALRMLVRQQGNNATIIEAGVCTRIAIDNTLYTGMVHHPEWGAWGPTTEYGVCMVDIQQLIAAGCQKITNKVDILYTVAHPNLGSVSMVLTGPMPAIALGPIPVTQNSFGTITHNFAATDPLCAYLVTLTATYLLTTGDSNILPVQDQIAFCR